MTTTPQQEPVQNEAQPESLRLAEAFRIFNQASEELSTAYTSLQSQVAALTSELAAANGALRQQYVEKAALTERLTLLLSALPAGVAVLDATGRVVQANPAAEATLGLALLGEPWEAVEREHLLPSETPGEYIAEVAHAVRRLAVTVTALDSAGGRIVLLHDITEAHRLKAQAERHERLAAMGEMAAQLAHQLRTPLSAALLYTANLETPDMAEATRISIAQKAVGRLKHLERLIQDVLLFARGEVLGREVMAVADLLQELRQTIEPLARTRAVLFQVGESSDELFLQGNRKAIVGALTNLLENALHAAGSRIGGEVHLSVRRAGETLAFAIRDNGPGMAATVVARLFEPFFTTRAEGTGLGLAIARGVARAHGGNIEVSSEPGVGTEFTVTLALAHQSAD
ncbi:MAG: ATP-binding protein [Sterolibacterium sp.]